MNKEKVEQNGKWVFRGGHWSSLNSEELQFPLTSQSIGIEDRWIFSRLHTTIQTIDEAMTKYRVNDVAKVLYDFIWHDFCDWYIELIKDRLYSPDEKLQRITLERAFMVFDAILKLLHPFMPFITEELWHRMEPGREGDSIMSQLLPGVNESFIDEASVDTMTFLQSLVESIRMIRGEMNILPSRLCNVVIHCNERTHETAIEENHHFLQRLARIETVTVSADRMRPKLSASAVVFGEEVFVPLEGLIDIEVEQKRLGKEIDRLKGLLKGIESKLGNEKFRTNAPADVVEKEQIKQENMRMTLEKLQGNLDALNAE